MARDAKKNEKMTNNSRKAAERSRNNLEVERLTKSTSVYMKEILLNDNGKPGSRSKKNKHKTKSQADGRKSRESKINFNNQKIKETIAQLEDESNKSSYNSAASGEQLSKRVAKIVR